MQEWGCSSLGALESEVMLNILAFIPHLLQIHPHLPAVHNKGREEKKNTETVRKNPGSSCKDS